MWYQHLCSHELDLMKSILGDEQDLAQAHLKVVDVQIGSIRNTLQDVGVGVIGKNGCRFDPGNNGPWCESSSDDSDSDKPRQAPSQAGSHCDSGSAHSLATVCCYYHFRQHAVLARGPRYFLLDKSLKMIRRSGGDHDPTVTIIILSCDGALSSSKSKPTIMSFQAFSCAPSDDLLSCTRQWSAVQPPISGLLHCISPYARGTSSFHVAYGGRTWFKDFSSTEQVALTWVERHMILNSVTTMGWLQDITSTEKIVAVDYITNIIKQANMKFGCVLEETHIAHWYAGKDSPPQDEDMRLELKTPQKLLSE
ncbi:uncharacterized protein BJ212DRAFT_1296508 [Suillus subaureus]|uniref:Uncharacterized protein n=1 Tax=Suillus subaureus TaxID=48587 RepID=A0A9P7EJ77_9AGAM|nr:uncharacterized protein BJ212DRAFT_1296508 [Suillus subaureus]KAG1822444.1 hypothetical protein BJ212DRAFT_1296508 [Suillus subaureus]